MTGTCEVPMALTGREFDLVESVWNGGRLRELRELAGFTQAELAKLIGVGQNSVSRWERGDQEPQWSACVALSAAIGVPLRAFGEKVGTPIKVRPPKPKPADDTITDDDDAK